jgi:hypothetical protein
MIVGLAIRSRHLLYQGLLFVFPVAAGVFYFAFPERGTFATRTATLSAIAALFIARILWQTLFANRTQTFETDGEIFSFYKGPACHAWSMTAAALLTVYIPIEMSGHLAKYMTIAWACEGLLLLILGFALRDRALRFSGLGLLAVCVLKVFYDLWILDIERVYKVIALIGLGGILILTGWFYSRYREQIRRFLVE